jgi:hypothetical protein
VTIISLINSYLPAGRTLICKSRIARGQTIEEVRIININTYQIPDPMSCDERYLQLIIRNVVADFHFDFLPETQDIAKLGMETLVCITQL